MGHMAPVGTQRATPTGQTRRLFVAVGVVGKVNDVTYQVGYSIHFHFQDE